MADTCSIKVSDVVFRDDLYPRIEPNPQTVQKYAEDLEVLPAIEVNQNNELIDGWHRWTAHKKKEAETILAIVTETESDAHLLELAIERNAKHGFQLSLKDKRKMAQKIYSQTDIDKRVRKREHLADILSVTVRTVENWIKDIDRDAKEERDVLAYEMWLACHTQEEIAEATGVSRKQQETLLRSFETFQFCAKLGQQSQIEDQIERLDAIEAENRSDANHESDFSIPIYNIWRKQSKTNEVAHFGNSEATWVDNLLYLYTKPFDVVADPFGGGGSTIDVCKKRLRRYLVSDRKPIVEREAEIRKHDIADGPLKPPQWKDVSLVYLDPPYWRQAEGEYSKDAEDLANMPIGQFNEMLSGLIKQYAKKLNNAHIALIIQPTQWRADNKETVDHIADMIRAVDLPLVARYSAPYSTEQCTPQMVEWAKANKACLVLSREIVVWRVA